MSFMILAISLTILHLVFLYIGSMPAFAKMEMMVPFGSILTLHVYFFCKSRGEMHLLVSLSFLGVMLGFSTKETKVLLYLSSSLAKFRRVISLAITVIIFFFSVVVNRNFLVFYETCKKARNSEKWFQ